MEEQAAIFVHEAHKSFKLPHEKFTGLKQALINFSFKKNYETQQVLKGISFEVKKGEFFGIVGRNGSGKSTLLKLMAQIYTPDSGVIKVNGTLTPFIELGVGFNPELTGKENVFLNGALLGFDRKQMAKMYPAIVAFAELEKFMDQKLKNYSSGMQVRLAFSIAIRAESDILLVDEVLAVGDASFMQKCYTYFEEMKRSGRTVILVTHDMSAVNRFCNRALMLDKGEIKKIGQSSEIASIYRVSNIDTSRQSHEKFLKNLPKTNRISFRILGQTPKNVRLDIEYDSKEEYYMYVGITLLKEGQSIAEITTPTSKPLRGEGGLTYTFATTGLNSGVYEVEVALFKRDNRELIAVPDSGGGFTIPGYDSTRGAALKLADTWEYR